MLVVVYGTSVYKDAQYSSSKRIPSELELTGPTQFRLPPAVVRK